MKPENMQIPSELFNALLDVLEYIDTSNYTVDFRDELEDVWRALKEQHVMARYMSVHAHVATPWTGSLCSNQYNSYMFD
jgi:hypothetical protein